LIANDYISVGNELGGNARLFRVYQDRMNEMDNDTIAGWTDTINFLLVFVSLQVEYIITTKL